MSAVRGQITKESATLEKRQGVDFHFYFICIKYIYLLVTFTYWIALSVFSCAGRRVTSIDILPTYTLQNWHKQLRYFRGVVQSSPLFRSEKLRQIHIEGCTSSSPCCALQYSANRWRLGCVYSPRPPEGARTRVHATWSSSFSWVL